MRLPWLQIDQDGLNRCRLLARLLGIPDTQGIGIGVSLWQWALEMAPEGDFTGLVPDSGILAAAVGWSVPDAGRLVSELQRVGMVATAPTLRVRGLDRYRRAWEKNTRGKRKPSSSGAPVPETGANPAPVTPEPAPQTQTQIEKKKKETTTPRRVSVDESKLDELITAHVAKPHRLRITEPDTSPPPPEPPPTPPELVSHVPREYAPPASKVSAAWSASEFHSWCQARRQEGGLFGEPEPRGLSAWYAATVSTLGGDVAVLQAAWERYCAHKHWSSEGAPFRVFMRKWSEFARKAPERPPVDPVWAELWPLVLDAFGDQGAYVAQQLQQLSWRGSRGAFIGTTADGYLGQWVRDHFGAQLEQLGVTIAGPAVQAEAGAA